MGSETGSDTVCDTGSNTVSDLVSDTVTDPTGNARASRSYTISPDRQNVGDSARRHALHLPGVVIREHAVLERQHGDVGVPALAKRADLRKMIDGARRGHGGAIDEVFEFHAEREHLRHAVGHVRL